MIFEIAPNEDFQTTYDFYFSEDPALANVYLLLFGLAIEKGRIEIGDDDLATLAALIFKGSDAYMLERKLQ